MANIFRIRRRVSGASGAPSSLKNAELAFNELDKVLWYGQGDASGDATSIIPIGGEGAFLTLTSTQTVSGNKTFSGTLTVATPAADFQAATKKYVDDLVSSASIPDGDKGDVTVSASGASWTIDAGVVTNAKLANVATGTFKGRKTAATGAVEDLTASDAKTLLAITYADIGGTAPTWNQDTTGSAAKWTAPRTLTIGGTGKATDGSADVSWTIAEVFSASQPAKTFLAAPTGSTGAPTFRTLVAGDLPDLSATYQPLNFNLTAIDNLTSAANKVPMFTGSGAATLIDFSTNVALGSSDTTVSSQKAVKTYIDGIIAANDAMVFKGVINCSANPNYPAADAGWTYRVSVAGKIGGASGQNVEVGDILLCTADGSTSGDQAAVGANWGIIQVNIDGALTTANIGVSVQGYSAALSSIGGLSTAADKGVYTTASNTYATFSLTSGGRALGGVAGTANTFPYFSALNTVTLGSISAAGLALIDDADVATQRTTLGLGTMATQAASSVAITGGTIDGVTIDGGTF